MIVFASEKQYIEQIVCVNTFHNSSSHLADKPIRDVAAR